MTKKIENLLDCYYLIKGFLLTETDSNPISASHFLGSMESDHAQIIIPIPGDNAKILRIRFTQEFL